MAIVEGETIIASGRFGRPLCHCPHQAHVAVSERCIYDCTFCPVPRLHRQVKTLAEIVGMVEDTVRVGEFRAISLTNRVAESSSGRDPVRRRGRAGAAEEVRSPDRSLGVSHENFVRRPVRRRCLRDQVQRRDDGPRDLCAGLSGALASRYPSRAPGRRRDLRPEPGLLERHPWPRGDRRMRQGRGETLAGMGVIPNLRPISPHPLRRGDSGRSPLRGSTRPTRTGSRTLCLPCTGCDLVTYIDL